jgi:hypothetical protein
MAPCSCGALGRHHLSSRLTPLPRLVNHSAVGRDSSTQEQQRRLLSTWVQFPHPAPIFIEAPAYLDAAAVALRGTVEMLTQVSLPGSASYPKNSRLRAEGAAAVEGQVELYIAGLDPCYPSRHSRFRADAIGRRDLRGSRIYLGPPAR